MISRPWIVVVLLFTGNEGGGETIQYGGGDGGGGILQYGGGDGGGGAGGGGDEMAIVMMQLKLYGALGSGQFTVEEEVP